MPQDYTATNPQTGETVRWDGKAKAWTKIASPAATPGAFQSKPGGTIRNVADEPHLGENPLRAIPRTFLESFGVDVDKVENAKSDLESLKGMYGDVANTMGEGMFNSLMKAGPLAPLHMTASVIDGIAHQIEDGSKKAYQSHKSRDRYGLYQGLTQVVSAMGQLALLREARPAIEKSTELGGRAVRGAARLPLGVGKVAEEGAREAALETQRKTATEAQETSEFNAQKVAEARKDYEAAKKSIDDQHAQKLRDVTEHNTRAVSEGRQKHADAIRKIDEEHVQAHQERFQKMANLDKEYERGVDLRKRIVGIKARLMSWSDKIGDIVDQTRKNIDEHFDRRYNAFRESLGPNPEVTWTPMQIAVEYAKDHFLEGSPESIKIFNEIAKEGPQLDEETVRRVSQRLQASENLKAMMIGKNLDEATKARMEAALHDQGAPGGEQTRIPHKDAWGYVKELEGRIASKHWPSDVYRAMRYVADEGQKQLTEAAEKAPTGNKGPEWKQLQSDYANMKTKWDDSKSPANQIREARNSEVKSGIISGTNGQELADILAEYKQFSPDPQALGKLKGLRAALKNLPSPAKLSTPEYPELPVRGPDPTEGKIPGLQKPPIKPEYPEGPDYKGTKEPPDRPQAFDPAEWRRQRLQEYQQRMGGRQPGTTWQTMQVPFYRLMSALYSNPLFVKMILGIK
jgi:hypothetical protein